MARLRDYFFSDLNSIFNTDEFAEYHNIDGRDLLITIDRDRLIQRSKKEYDGISVGELLYFVKASDYGSKPEQGRPQRFDNRLMYIFDVREDVGLYEIILQQNRGE